MNKLDSIYKNSARLLLVVASVLFLFLPTLAVSAQSLDVSHHLQHVDVAACSAACTTTASSRSENTATSNAKVASKGDTTDEFSSEESLQPEVWIEEFIDRTGVYLPDKARTYISASSLLL